MATSPRRFIAYVLASMTLFIAAITVVAVHGHGSLLEGKQYWDLLVLCALAVIAEILAVDAADRATFAASNLPLLLAMMFLGPGPAMVVAVCAAVWGCWRVASWPIAVFNVANYGLSALLGSLAFEALRSALGFSLDTVTPSLLLSGAVAAFVYEITNNAAVGIGAALKYGTTLSDWRREMPPFLRSLGILSGVGLMVAALYAVAGIVAVAVLFLPLFASQYMFQLLGREKQHLSRQRKLTEQYLEMNIGLAAAMISLLDSKDQYTARHCAAVAMYCRDMAAALGLGESETEALHLAGLLHDLGKVGTPDAILGKEGLLDSDEWEYIHEHPMKGAEVLSHLVAYRDVADIVQYHHERLDGSGYPLGVRSQDIPELAKILAVADSYHAMTSDRPYRGAMSSFEALKVLRQNAGVLYEPLYVETLGQILRDKDLAYREGRSTDFNDEYERGRLSLRLRGAAFSAATEGDISLELAEDGA